MRVSLVLPNSSIYGPGLRTVVWTQGCSIRCPGCWNDALWDFKGGYELSAQKIVEDTINQGNIGLTILGGEPLDQAESVSELIDLCHENNLNIMLYTGYEYEELNDKQSSCVENADIVVIGRYVEELRSEELLWRGSTNQRIIWNMDKPKDVDLSERRQVEVRYENDGNFRILGYPSDSMMMDLTKRFGKMKGISKGRGKI